MSRGTRRPTRITRPVVAGAALALATTGVLVAPVAADEVTGPKNVILLISDGGGYNQFDAANLYEAGSARNQIRVDPSTGSVENIEPGAPVQVYDEWPVQVGQSHFSANGRATYSPELAWGDFSWVASGATDSAAAGTALGTGVKTNNGMLGYRPSGDQLLTVGEQALAVGKGVGLVTSVPFNHATPAGFIAHNTNRNDYQGLATEMIDSGATVVMGAGHPNFTDAHTSRASNWTWISQNDFQRVSSGNTEFDFVETKADFEALAAGTDVPEKVFGLAQVAETLQYNRPGLGNRNVTPFTDRENDVPSLETMAQGALNVLEQNDEGFFLMIEGGAVDWAGHANQTTRIVEEQVHFNDAVEAVNTWVEENSSWEETLVVITADHETGYLAGVGAGTANGWTPMAGNAGELPQVTWHSGNHTNDLVPVFAKGAGSERLAARATSYDLVRGAYLDNTDIGEVVFDILGHTTTTNPDGVSVQVDVPFTGTPAGELSLVVPTVDAVELTDSDGVLTAALPPVTVSDTRSEVQAQGKGWTVSGAASDFNAGNRVLGAENLSWTPAVVEGQAVAGGQAALDAPAVLADADRVNRVGTSVVTADLGLAVPADAEAGSYSSEITLTLFAKD